MLENTVLLYFNCWLEFVPRIYVQKWWKFLISLKTSPPIPLSILWRGVHPEGIHPEGEQRGRGRKQTSFLV